MLPTGVTQYLDSNRERHLASLFEFLRIPSVSNLTPTPDPCERAAGWLVDYLRKLGLQASAVPMAGLHGAGKPNVLASLGVRDDAPTVLFYGHYDVQPAEPLELWKSEPFQPVVRDGCIYARGANDNKGQFFTQLMAVEAWLRSGQRLPINLKLFVEGEEEIGSPALEPFVAAHAEELACDTVVISDSQFFAEDVPSIDYALRGLVYAEVTVQGPSHDIHSGLHGGAVANPANVLATLIAAMQDADGRITIPGFYDDVLPLTEAERKEWRKLPFDEAAYAASLGVAALGGGEKKYSFLERVWARPTLDCNGVWSGYTGEGSKTIIPGRASAKISMRLVANQAPEKIQEAFRRFVAAHTPAGATSSVSFYAGARPVLLATDSPAMRAARAACEFGFGRPPALIRCGASVPVTELFQRILKRDALMMGFGLPSDNLHAPNERFNLDQLWRGSRTIAALIGELGERMRKTPGR
jgi:acetylornithine deacetylase/succinyl-diaminopimelate desuccinylase-like protein